MKALFYSIATASLAGLLSGGAMALGPKALADRPIGPQILITGVASRAVDADGWYAGPSMISYNGQVPDYVIGNDWAQPASYEASADDYSDDAAVEQSDPQVEEAIFVTPIRIDPPNDPTPVSYPSVDGDILAGVVRRQTAPQVVEIPADPNA